MFLICFAFVMCWPAISALWPPLAVYSPYRPWIVLGGPVLYGLSHVVFIAGMALSGAEYSRIFFRWAARVGVERLLACGPATAPR